MKCCRCQRLFSGRLGPGRLGPSSRQQRVTSLQSSFTTTRGRQRNDSTHVLAAVRKLNRIGLLAETLRAALEAITVAAPDWLRAAVHPDWHERYGRRIGDRRLPDAGPKRDAYAAQVGTDGHQLLDALAGKDVAPDVAALPAVAVLCRVWARHFEQDEDGRGGRTPPNARSQPHEPRASPQRPPDGMIRQRGRLDPGLPHSAAVRRSLSHVPGGV